MREKYYLLVLIYYPLQTNSLLGACRNLWFVTIINMKTVNDINKQWGKVWKGEIFYLTFTIQQLINENHWNVNRMIKIIIIDKNTSVTVAWDGMVTTTIFNMLFEIPATSLGRTIKQFRVTKLVLRFTITRDKLLLIQHISSTCAQVVWEWDCVWRNTKTANTVDWMHLTWWRRKQIMIWI